MAWLLMMLVGCGVGNDSTVYDACITVTELFCECGDTSNGGGPTGYCDEEENEAACAKVEEEDGGDPLLAYQNCFNAAYSTDCKKKAAEAACQEEYDAYLAE